MKAIRDNEPRAISLGYRVNDYKLALFVLSTTLAGLAGATKAIVFQLASLTDVHWSMSGEPVLMTLLGGLGTVFGPLIGAAVIVSMQNYLATLGAWVLIVQGIIFVTCVLVFREGLLGLRGQDDPQAALSESPARATVLTLAGRKAWPAAGSRLASDERGAIRARRASEPAEARFPPAPRPPAFRPPTFARSSTIARSSRRRSGPSRELSAPRDATPDPPQSIETPASLTTGVHFASSTLTCSASASGVDPTTVGREHLHALADLWVLHGLHGLGVEPVDDRLRRAFGANSAFHV